MRMEKIDIIVLPILIFLSVGFIGYGIHVHSSGIIWVGLIATITHIVLYNKVINHEVPSSKSGYYAGKSTELEVYKHAMTWQDYEKVVRNEFISAGLSAELTQPGADGGIDVIATYKGMKIGIQVKYYQHKVSNKAVGEVLMGMDMYGCDYGCVVAPSGYTYPCEKQARKSRIELISHEDIENYVSDIKMGRV